MEEAYLHWYEEICQCLEGSYYHLVNCVHGIIEENKIQNGDSILSKILPFFVSHKKYPHSFSSLPSFATSSHSPSKPGSLRCLTTPSPLCGSPRLTAVDSDACFCYESLDCIDLNAASEIMINADSPRKQEERSRVEVEEAAAVNANRLLAGISDCAEQIWKLYDVLVKTVRENAGCVCEQLRTQHAKVLRDYLNRFVLLNRLTELDLSGEVKKRVESEM